MHPDDLQFKEQCDGCGGHLSWIDAAYVCSNECTWCTECAQDLAMTCPRCSEPLARRARRTQPAAARARRDDKP